jgi:hypothetical protein
LVTKVIKSIKNIFKKVLANEKSLCIFALGFQARELDLFKEDFYT